MKIGGEFMPIIVNDGIVIQAYNNNTVCIKMLGKEKILFSKGIGFGKNSVIKFLREQK